MAEYIKCPICHEYINLEIDVYRDELGLIYCCKCNTQIVIN